ncbi:hypothetical protein IH980_02745 [Patescibacteria group bacterium]|nr:hypothetical protein [Patescibacteria group bacterium]
MSPFPARKKLLLTIGLIFTLLVFVGAVKKAHAQPAWFIPVPEEHAAALQECQAGDVGLECTVQAIVTSIANSFNYGLGGDPTGGPTLGRRPGAIHFASNLLGTLVANPPISSGDYVQYVAQRLNIAEPAYAQAGTGFRALQPLIPLWAAFRNIAYLAFVVIFILIGFMIMFRARLDPQTVVNVQNSLPKLVITLLLITFSYAIAGFLVDLIYLGIFVIVSVLASQGLIDSAAAARTTLIGENLFTFIFKGGIFRAGDTAGEAIRLIIEKAIDNDALGAVAGFLGDPFVQVIMTIALLFSVFRLFFQLLIAYVQIVILTIFAPIMILFNALPGSQSFGNWLRNFLSNILLFPAVAALILVAAILMGPCESTGPDDPCSLGREKWGISDSLIERYPDQGWLPPFIGFTTDTKAVIALIGYGFILFAPQMVSALQKALKAQPIPAAGVFAPLAAGARVATAPIRAPLQAIGAGARVFVGQKIESLAGETRKRG